MIVRVVRAAGAVAGAAIVAIAATPPSADPQPGGGLVREGRSLYADGCQSCHGPNGEGVTGTGPRTAAGGDRGAGPPLRGAGAASVDFYLSTGYMPLDDPRDRPRRSEPSYTPRQIRAIVAYVETFGGGGPPIPAVDPQAGDVAEGFELFADRCAGCHQVAIQGGIVLGGIAPELTRTTPRQLAEAVRVGPQLMPRFGERDLSPREVDSLAAFVLEAQDPRDPGGWGIGHLGPVPEGLVAWLVAALALVGVARLIGSRLE